MKGHPTREDLIEQARKLYPNQEDSALYYDFSRSVLYLLTGRYQTRIPSLREIAVYCLITLSPEDLSRFGTIEVKGQPQCLHTGPMPQAGEWKLDAAIRLVSTVVFGDMHSNRYFKSLLQYIYEHEDTTGNAHADNDAMKRLGVARYEVCAY